MTDIQKQALLEGTQIAVYEIKEILGSNLSEIIYRAWNGHLNGMVILKEFFPSQYALREDGTQAVKANSQDNISILEFGLGNFIQQNEKLLEVQHPGAQTVHNILEFNQTAYLAVDEEKGSLLSEYLENGETYSEGELKMLLDSLLETLGKFHEAGVVHGDIHPGNILIKKNGKPVLLNFASARQRFSRLIDNPSAELQSGYGAPEQYLEGGSTEPSSDLYALGAILYRCITGGDPEDARNRLSDFNAHKPDPLEPILNKTDSGFSGEFLVTVDWMLQVDSKSRPQSTSEIFPALNNKDSSSFKYIAASSPSKNEVQQGKPVVKVSSGRRFSAATLAASMLASATLGSAVTWYLHQKEISLDSTVSGQQSQEAGAFGQAIGKTETNVTEEQEELPTVVATADAAPSTEKVSGIIATIESQAALEPSLDTQITQGEEAGNRLKGSLQKKAMDEPVVKSSVGEGGTSEAEQKDMNVQIAAPSEANRGHQAGETSVEVLEVTPETATAIGAEAEVISDPLTGTSNDQGPVSAAPQNTTEVDYNNESRSGEADANIASLPAKENAESQTEGAIGTVSSRDTRPSTDIVESNSASAVAPETTPSVGNTKITLSGNTVEALETASKVEGEINSSSVAEVEPLTEGQVISAQSEKEIGALIASQEENSKAENINLQDSGKDPIAQISPTADGANVIPELSTESGVPSEDENVQEPAVEAPMNQDESGGKIGGASTDQVDFSESNGTEEKTNEPQKVSPAATDTGTQLSVNSGEEAPDAAPLPELLTQQFSESAPAQEPLAGNTTDQAEIENPDEVAAASQVESLNKDKAQGGLSTAETAPVNDETAISKEAGVMAVSADAPSPESLDDASRIDNNVNPLEVSLVDQIVPDEVGNSLDIFVSNPEEILEKNQSERALISQYMVKAKENVAALQLTTPAENNALYYYKLVLEIDPQNEEALKGVEDIFDKYVVLINNAIKNNKTAIAQRYLDRAKTILPSSLSHQEVIEYLSEALVTKSQG